MIRNKDISCLAALYKKRELVKDAQVYCYEFVDVIINPAYNEDDNTITMYANNTKNKLYNINDLEFTISDEKLCYTEYIEIDEAIDKYSVIEDDLIVDKFIEQCKNNIKLGYLNQDTLTIVNTNLDMLKKAKKNEMFGKFQVEDINDMSQIVFSKTLVEEMITKLKNNKSKDVIDQLEEVLGIMDYISMIDINDQNFMPAYYDFDNEEEFEKKEIDYDSLDTEPTKTLDDLIGLEKVKILVTKLTNYLEYLVKLDKKIEVETPNLNMVFKGNPGTGKTTIAKILAHELYELGYIEENKVKEATAQDFIAGYVGQTAIKTKKLLEKLEGGVVLVDEAYSFAGRGQEFAQEALAELMKAMEKNNTVFIFAGYKDEMDEFINMNPGFKDRIGRVINFEDYTEEQLLEMFKNKVKKAKLKITREALEEVKNKIIEAKTTKHFSNGRYVDRLFEKVLIEQAQKIEVSDNIEMLRTITKNEVLSVQEEKDKVKILGF